MTVHGLLAIAVAIAVCSMYAPDAGAQSFKGNLLSKVFPDDLDLEGVSMSEDGKYAVLVFEREIWGISIDEGTTLWTRKLQDDYDRKFDVVQWISRSEVVIPTDTDIEFISFPDGATKGKIRVPGDDMGSLMETIPDVVEGTDRIEVERFGNLMIIPFDDGFQVIDLLARKVLLDATEELDDIRHDFWGRYMMLWGDMDDFWVFDLLEPRLIKTFKNGTYKTEGPSLEKDVYQRFLVVDGVLAVFFDDEIASFSAQDGGLKGTIGVDATSCDTYHPLITAAGPKLLVQIEERLSSYNLLTGKQDWSLPLGDTWGVLMEAWTLDDDDILMTRIGEDDFIFVSRVDPTTGKTRWERRVVASEYGYESGHYHSVSFGEYMSAQFLGNRNALLSSSQKGFRNFILDSLGVQTFYSQHAIDSVGPWTEKDFLTLLTENCIHEEASAHGVVRFLGVRSEKLAFLAQGRVHPAWENGEPDMNEKGEGLIVLDPKTGSVVSATHIPMFKEADKDKFALFWTHHPISTAHGDVIVGTHSVIRVSPDLKVDTINCNTEERVKRVDVGMSYVTVSYEDPDGAWWLEQVDYTGPSLKRTIMGVGVDEKVFAVSTDTSFARVTLRYIDGKIEAYDPMHEIPKKWGTPRWVLSEDQLDKLDLGDFDCEDIQSMDFTRNNFEGIVQGDRGIYVRADNALAVIGYKDGCVQRMDWEGYTLSSLETVKRLKWFREMPGGVLFDLSNDIGVLQLTGDCSFDVMGYQEVSRSDIRLVYTDLTSRVMICDLDRNRLDVIQLNR